MSATVRVNNEKTAVVRGAGAWGEINAAYRRYAWVMNFHVDACPPCSPGHKGKVECRVPDQRLSADPSTMCWRDLGELQAWSDEQCERSARWRLCPVTGSRSRKPGGLERGLLTPLPETLPESFGVVHTCRVGLDALVSFEARNYSVPFVYIAHPVEVRGCARSVQILAHNAIIATHPRKTAARLVIDPAHYEGLAIDRVMPSPPLGRMGQLMQHLAPEPVAHRSIDLYARLVEVAR